MTNVDQFLKTQGRLTNSFFLKLQTTRDGKQCLFFDNIAVALFFFGMGALIIAITCLMVADARKTFPDTTSTFWQELMMGRPGYLMLMGLSCIVGIIFLFKWKKVTFDMVAHRVTFESRWLWRNHKQILPLGNVFLEVTPSTICNPGGFDWSGYAVKIVFGEGKIMLARTRNVKKLEDYVNNLINRLNIEVVTGQPS